MKDEAILWINNHSAGLSLLVVFIGISVILLYSFILPFVDSNIVYSQINSVTAAQTAGLDDNKAKALAITQWFHDENFDTSKAIQDPVVAFKNRTADCVGLSNLFVVMSKSIGLPARVVGTNGEHHFWVEIFTDGRWINLDTWTDSNGSYDYPHFYLDRWGSGGRKFSYIYWIDKNGETQNVTSKYMPTGTIETRVYKNGIPSMATVIVKSHSLMDENQASEPQLAFEKVTDKNGGIKEEFGDNNYTVSAEQPIIPLLPYLLVFKSKPEELTLKEGQNKIINLEISSEIAQSERFNEFKVIYAVWITYIIIIAFCFFLLVRAIRNSSSREKL